MTSVGSISVLMPVRNGARFLGRVLSALCAQRLDVPWDFLAIDSGSQDGTLAILEHWQSRFPVPFRVRHIHPTAFNHGDTRNLLAAESNGDLLVFLTQDAIPVGHDWLAKLARNFQDRRVGAAYSRNVPREDAELLTRVFSEHDPGYVTGHRRQAMPQAAEYASMDPHQKRLLFNFNNVASAIRRSLWELHPFPRTDFGEDILMARALIESGSEVVYDDEAIVEHSHDYTADEMRERARVDGRFNIEWLGRRNVESRTDADVLTRRQLVRDREALVTAGVSADDLDRSLKQAEDHRRAAFLGMYEGGTSKTRRRPTRMLRKRSLRVLYVVHGFPPDTWAGTEVYTLELALEIQRRGHDVAVMSRVPAATGTEPPRADFSVERQDFRGLPVWRMTYGLGQQQLRDSYQLPGAESAFRDVLDQVKPDVVHFQHLIHLSAGLPLICRELGVPTVMTVNDYWALCARVQLIRPDGVRCEENQGLGCLLCVKERTYDRIPIARRILPALRPMARPLRIFRGFRPLNRLAERAGELCDIGDRHEFVSGAYASCDLLLAPSRFMRSKLLESGKFNPEQVVYSDYGMRTGHEKEFVRRPSSDGRIRFGFVGSLLWYKGIDVLLRAMRELDPNRAVLNIFGDFTPNRDSYHAQLADIAADSGQSVAFHGRFDNRDLPRVYREIDVLVVPSIWFENSPVTIHEAFQFRTPVVTSDIGGMAELISDGRDGLHFAVGSAEDLAAKLRRFISEPQLLSALSDFSHIKTMQEDAREMEVRYRAVSSVIRDTGPSRVVQRPGWSFVARGGTVERQEPELALLRPGAWVEYDVSMVAPGPVAVRIAIQVLSMERAVPIGGTVRIDGAEVGRIDRFTSRGRNEVIDFQFNYEITQPAARLRIDTHGDDSGLYMRVAHVTMDQRSGRP